jgi:hypothetical protein
MDPRVKITSVRDTYGFDPVTLLPAKNKVITFMVATHGPFTLTYAPADYNDSRVQADVEKEVATLVAIGALPASAS